MSPTSYRAAPPRGDGCTVPQPLGLVNQTSHASGRLLRLLRARRRRLRLGRRGGRAGAADTELVHRGVVELTARRQAFLGLVIADRGRRAGAHHAIDRAGVVALIAQRLLRGPNIRPLALGRDLVLLALHLVHRRLGLGLGLVLGALGLVLGLVLGPLRLVLHLVRRGLGGGRTQNPHGADQCGSNTRQHFCHGTTS